MGKTVGIDLGTTNSAVAVMEGGSPEVIANTEGARVTPSVVAFKESWEELVGQIAERQGVLNPGRTIFSTKRFMGRRFSEVEEERKLVPYEIVEGFNEDVRFQIGDKKFAPEEIASRVIRKLADDASKYLGEKVTDAVITVPAYFNDSQRQATKDAGKIAGLNVLRIINEPTAASLAYGLDKKTSETILVFDLGGGTFDVSILEVSEGVFEVKSTNGDTHLGGENFDKVIVDWISEEFKKAQGIDLLQDKQALQRLIDAAKKAKIELSSTLETQISMPFITADANGPKHLDLKLSRAKLEDLTHFLVEKCRGPVEASLADAGLSKDDIDEVVLVGGQTRMPAVQKLVKELTGREPNQSVNPDEVVAIGAAIQGGVLAGEVEDVLLLDVTPISMGIETMGGLMTKVIGRNTTIPTRQSQVFSTAEDNQSAVDVHVLQGEREMAVDSRSLGQFRLDGIPPAPRGLPQVEVTFDIDANGILKVSARDKTSGKEQEITISGSTNLDQSEIERMIKEAQEKQEQDKQRRQEVEEHNEADSLVYQVERQLQEVGEHLPAHEKTRLEQLVSELKTALKDNAPFDQIHSLRSDLQQAAHSLSEAVAMEQAEGRSAEGCGSQGEPGGGSASGKCDDDVLDAEYEEK